MDMSVLLQWLREEPYTKRSGESYLLLRDKGAWESV